MKHNQMKDIYYKEREQREKEIRNMCGSIQRIFFFSKTKHINFDIFHFFFVYPKAINILNENMINDFSLNTLYTKLESIKLFGLNWLKR